MTLKEKLETLYKQQVEDEGEFKIQLDGFKEAVVSLQDQLTSSQIQLLSVL